MLLPLKVIAFTLRAYANGLGIGEPCLTRGVNIMEGSNLAPGSVGNDDISPLTEMDKRPYGGFFLKDMPLDIVTQIETLAAASRNSAVEQLADICQVFLWTLWSQSWPDTAGSPAVDPTVQTAAIILMQTDGTLADAKRSNPLFAQARGTIVRRVGFGTGTEADPVSSASCL